MSDDENLKVIFAGARRLTDGKLADAFVPLADPRSPMSLFERGKKTVSRLVGGVYSMKGTVEDASVKTLATAGGTFTGRWAGDSELVVEWEAADAAAKVKDRERKLVARLKSEPKLAQEMATLRRVYHRTPFADRAAFELMVLGELRKMPR